MRSAESWNVRGAVCEEGVSLEGPKVQPLIGFQEVFSFFQECGATLLQENRLSAGIYSDSVWGDLPFAQAN